MKRVAVAAIVSLLFVAFPTAAPAPADAGNPHVVSLVNSLAGLDPTTTFSVFGSGAQTVAFNATLGPRLTLPKRAMITEIGAYLNNCGMIEAGQPLCPDLKPLIAQVRPAVNGVPDPNTVLAAFEMSDDGDPLRVSFESASMHLMLPAGTYFVLFAPQTAEDSDIGQLLGSATDPLPYVPDVIPLGFLNWNGAYVVESLRAAIRIQGLVIPPGG